MSISWNLRTVRCPAETTNDAMQWWAYLPEVSRDAQEWCVAFERFGAEISKKVAITVLDLQHRKLEHAWCQLLECRSSLDAIEGQAPRSVVAMVENYYLSALAYYHYHAVKPGIARELLARAISLIEEAISIAPFLVPRAEQCYDYHLSLARIARAEGRWGEMFEQIEIGRRMAYGQLPLCATIRGPIYIEDVCLFYNKLRPLNEIEREALQHLSDPQRIQLAYDHRCVAATVVPFIVINWLGD